MNLISVNTLVIRAIRASIQINVNVLICSSQMTVDRRAHRAQNAMILNTQKSSAERPQMQSVKHAFLGSPHTPSTRATIMKKGCAIGSASLDTTALAMLKLAGRAQNAV